MKHIGLTGDLPQGELQAQGAAAAAAEGNSMRRESSMPRGAAYVGWSSMPRGNSILRGSSMPRVSGIKVLHICGVIF